ncbi:MAG: restriction endonuclease, SacI family [Candidatus Caldarchaeum sp.]|nr:restriction endonuclease, SacI family [Candidatus Caldarchaeum sp.]
MGRKLDIEKAKQLLGECFEQAEQDYLQGVTPHVSEGAQKAADILFATRVQSYREALLGCAIARVTDPQIDISLPYADQGENAFSGRTLDEQVINPFLVSKRIPCSKGPYLAVFRRSVRFVPETEVGLKDREGYRAFLAYLEELKRADEQNASHLLRYLLYRFVELREQTTIQLVRLSRLNLGQVQQFTEALLSKRSGGIVPLLLAVALLEAVSKTYQLGWKIEWQGINVSDRASGVGGDITVREGERIVMAIEVTERVIDPSRVEATFQSKISPLGIHDYLFAFTEAYPTPEAHRIAYVLFAQGHEVGFVRVSDWIYHNLATAGAKGRGAFLESLVGLFEQAPAAVKTLWNESVQQLLQTQAQR